MYAAFVVYTLTVTTGPVAPTTCTVETNNCTPGNACVTFTDADEGLCVNQDAYLDIAVGHAHMCGLRGDGLLDCWDRDPRNLFPTTPTLDAYVVEVVAGHNHICALLEDGRVECWGDNRMGQLGQGSTTPSATPMHVNLGIAVVELQAAADATCGLTENSTLICWGDNREGAFGIGTTGIIGDDELPGQHSATQAIDDFMIADDHICVDTTTGETACAGKSWNGKIRF